ncbi:MAG: hypothetical protein WBM17_09465 [Anaerolineales bacterium]
MNSHNSIPNRENNSGICCAAFSTRRAVFWGSVLVLLGVLGLLSVLSPSLQLGRVVLPAFLLLWGGVLLFGARNAQ